MAELGSSIQLIVEQKQADVDRRRAAVPLDALKRQIAEKARPRHVINELRWSTRPALFAEVQRDMPNGSARYSAVTQAMLCIQTGVNGLIVSTDDLLLYGHLSDLAALAGRVDVPLIQYDLFVDTYQVFEARALGADALNLTVRLLDDDQLREMLSLTQRLRMVAFLEVYSPFDLARAVRLAPRVVAFNSVDPFEGTVDFSLLMNWLDVLPGTTRAVSLHGIHTIEQLSNLLSWGVSGYGVSGQLLMSEAGAQVWQLEAEPRGQKDEVL
ncbi:MAG: hypothetical protein GYB68_18680 [Chloroflexi bacterium]|nr:hypothetical protein [Chloroflexota bacterium]